MKSNRTIRLSQFFALVAIIAIGIGKYSGDLRGKLLNSGDKYCVKQVDEVYVLERIKLSPKCFVNFKIPWSIRSQITSRLFQQFAEHARRIGANVECFEVVINPNGHTEPVFIREWLFSTPGLDPDASGGNGQVVQFRHGVPEITATEINSVGDLLTSFRIESEARPAIQNESPETTGDNE